MKINNGVITALITPFLPDGNIDYSSFESLLNHQWQNGVKQFVVNGTTAESPNLNKDEIEKLVSIVKGFSSQATLILGTGSNSTSKTIEMTNWGASLGVHAALVVVPYYNKPPQEGLLKHFSLVADKSEIPLMLYNVPGRTVISMHSSTVTKLSQHANIMGIKEASGDLQLLSDIKKQVKPDWKIFSGDDDSCLQLCSQGGHGVVSVVSHIIPKEISSLVESSLENNPAGQEKFLKYKNLLKYLYIEPNPIPVKQALKFMGLIKHSVVRLPLVEMSEKNSDFLYEELVNLELL